MILPPPDVIVAHGVKSRVVCCGGVYSNAHALAAFLGAVRDVAPLDVYCLGDLTGAYSDDPERALLMLRESGIHVIQGNADYTLAHDVGSCGCGYASGSDDERFGQMSYDIARCGVPRRWSDGLADLPHQVNLTLGDRRVRLCHGSPRVMNEFLWESLDDGFYRSLLDLAECDVIVCAHTGLPWIREVASGRWIVNCGVLGRPANDGTHRVWYADLLAGEAPRLIALEFDWATLVHEMTTAAVAAEFVTSIREGWWACCYDILPAAEKARGKYSSSHWELVS